MNWREGGPIWRDARRRLAMALLMVCGLSVMAGAAEKDGAAGGKAAAGEDLTFFVVSDTHYGLSPVGDATIPLLVDKMNALPGTPYPAALGGSVGAPRGVIHVGDVTNDGKAASWDKFVKDYGLDGTDGRLKYPVYETFGNHDGGATSPVRQGIKQRNAKRVGVKDVSESGLLYAWDWGRVRFVCLGISPGTTRKTYDPVNSTDFAVRDLAKHVGSSGRPVVLLLHFGFDKEYSLSWWPEEWRTQYRDAIKGYNVVGILHGHSHKPLIYTWEGFDVYHPTHFRQTPAKTGPVTHGFFVVHLTAAELTVAERKLDDTWGMTSKKPLKQTGAGT
jgi:cytolysin (calcineurin-like family phosphatase)